MGTFTFLHPTVLCEKEFSGITSYTWCPLLWLSMFSLSDIFIEKTEDGDNYACAETTVKKAQDRLRRIQEAIKGNGYLEAILAPLEFFQISLSASDKKDGVGFDLMEFQNYDGAWSPSGVMPYLEGIEPVIKAFDIIIEGGPITEALKLLHEKSVLFNGSIAKDKKAIKKEMQDDLYDGSDTLYVSAFDCLMGGLCGEAYSPQEKRAEKQYYSWIEQNRNIWEEDTENNQQVNLIEPEKEPENPDEAEKPSKTKKIKDGLVKEYDEDGTLTAKLNYKNGKLNGLCRYYDGKELRRELNYKNGKRNGLCKYWESGKHIRSVSYFKNDRLNGLDKFYDVDPTCLSEKNMFKNGRVVKKLEVKIP